MVKVRGPLFSVDAAGTFADAVVFQHNIYGVYVRRKELLRKTNTIAQVYQNAEFSQSIEDWHSSSDEIKKMFEEGKSLYHLSAYSAFIKEWFSIRTNCIFGYACYGLSKYGEFAGTMLKKTIL